ncbi:hypothetical protein RN001_009800 [Aquatica leii]|uniref:U3 small nucleolar RNA-associated protein 6 homolog n=1 Tax=Aquatica leii TaxID=1421715 RepID=A0AAN7PU44_9COLE|nr:hypothetical protein RN001_009800 [Aquatica leii]
MTDVVQKRLESMHEEIEEMRRVKLFSIEETRIILKRRKEFEHKIYAMAKDLKSYEDYITYERCLLKDIQLRRDKLKIGEKRNSIEHKIIKRIKVLYECAMQRFPTDVSVFLAFVKFCKKVNYINAAVETIAKMIKLHTDKPEVWKIAAGFHAYDRKDVNTAMMMLLKAIEIHKDCKILYKEIISVEIFNTVNNNSEIKKSVERLKEIMHTIFANINDLSFYIDTLTQLEEHACTIEVQDMIIKKLMKDYIDNELVWHTLAQRERKGLHYDPEEKSENTTESQLNTRTPKAKLNACFAKYKEGLEKVSDNVKKNLWCMYLDFLIELQQDTLGGATVLKNSTLKQALNEAYIDEALKEKHFVSWLEVIPEEDALEIAEKGTHTFPQSVDLWQVRFKLQVLKGDSSKVDQVFKLAIKNLKEKGLPLWLSILRYHYLSSRRDYVELIYRDGIKQPKEISDRLKPRYLEWICYEHGIETARKVYKELAVQKPYCKELHKMMAKLEGLQVGYDFNHWEEVHELACKQFGKEDVDVWIKYIKFYVHYYREHPNSGERVVQICNRAEEALPKTLIFEFLTRYSKLKESS